MKRFMRLFGAPLALAALTLAGLTAALLGGEPWSPAAWIALGVPLAVLFWRIIAAQR